MKMWSEITLDLIPFYWIIEEILTNKNKNQRIGTLYLYNIQRQNKTYL